MKSISLFLVLLSVSTFAMSCKTHLGAKKFINSEVEHNNKSAVDSLGLGAFRNSENSEIQKWVTDHNQRTTLMLNTGKDGKADTLFKQILDRSLEINPKNPPAVVEISQGVLMGKGGNLVLKNTQGEEVILVPKVVLPNNGGAIVVTEFKVSPNAKYVAYAQVKNGLDLIQWSVLDLATQKTIAGPFDVRMLEFNWALDSEGVYFTKWASVQEAQQNIKYAHNYFVDLKTGQSRLVFVPPQADNIEFYGIEELVSVKGQKQLIAYRTQGAAEVPNALYLGTLGKADPNKLEFQVGHFKWHPLVLPKTSSLGRLIAVRNGELIIRTSDAGNTFGLVKMNPVTGKTKVLIPAQKNEVLLVAQLIGDQFFLQYIDTKQFHNMIKIYSLNGTPIKSFKMSDLDKTIPNTGALTPMTGHTTSENLYFTYSDVAQTPVTVKVNRKTLAVEKLVGGEVNFDASKIDYKLSYATSQDGTKIPYKTWSRNDVQKPKVIYLYYYGFIGIAQLGGYNKKFQAQLDLGGAVSIVSPRGGGDYGRDFQLEPKIDRFKSMEDIVAAAKELQAQYPGVPIVASGRSFGGMMTLMLAVHYPQYFAGFSSVVPVTDVNEFLNRGLFGRFAGDDFKIPRAKNGFSNDSSSWRDALNDWNPLWNLKKLKAEDVKPIIIFSGTQDERVGPEQGRFFVQAFVNQFPELAGKIHYYEEPLNGHNGRTEFAQESAFIARLIGLQPENFKPLVKGSN